MASVVFIIRVPYREGFVNSKTEDKTTKVGSNKIDLKNVEENKGETAKEADVHGQTNDANQADDTKEDVEVLTCLNLAEVVIHVIRISSWKH